MITFGRKLKHLRQKNHLTQKELGMAVGFPDSCADVRIAQYESDVRTPKEDLMKLFASSSICINGNCHIVFGYRVPIGCRHFLNPVVTRFQILWQYQVSFLICEIVILK